MFHASLEKTGLQSLGGIGTAPSVAKRSHILHGTRDDSSGPFPPYVIPSIPLTLWGRDMLSPTGTLAFKP